MPIRSIPRHQLETTSGDYLRMTAALAGFANRHARVREFESRFADFVGCDHAIALSSGRQALHLVLKHLDLPPQSEAIIPAFNYFAVVERFLHLGLIPRFADVRRQDLNIDVAAVRRLATPKTRVVLATHMFGHPCDMDALVHLADRNDAVLIEDCAHALGTRYRDRHIGTFGRAGIFSLSVMKLVTAFGGGVVTTNDAALAERIRHDLAIHQGRSAIGSRLRTFAKGALLDAGTRTLPFSLIAGPALRIARTFKPDIQQRLMTERPHRVTRWRDDTIECFHAFQATLGLSQIARARHIVDRRRLVSAWLDEGLCNVRSVETLRTDIAGRSNGMYYGILVDQPEALAAHLFARGIDSETSEYLNCAEMDIYGNYAQPCPVAESVQRRILRLPNHPRMTKADADRIVAAVQSFEQSAATHDVCAGALGWPFL